jgi:hypothetical protein
MQFGERGSALPFIQKDQRVPADRPRQCGIRKGKVNHVRHLERKVRLVATSDAHHLLREVHADGN